MAIVGALECLAGDLKWSRECMNRYDKVFRVVLQGFRAQWECVSWCDVIEQKYISSLLHPIFLYRFVPTLQVP